MKALDDSQEGIELSRLRPAAAWREAERKSIVAGILGFFFCGGLQATGALGSTLATPSVAGLSGIVAFFLTYLALSVAKYHRRWRDGVVVGTVFFFLPFAVNSIWARVSHRPLMIPTILAGLLGYATIKAMHVSASKQPPSEYFRELTKVDAAEFQSKWAEITFWVLLAIGAIVTLGLILPR